MTDGDRVGGRRTADGQGPSGEAPSDAGRGPTPPGTGASGPSGDFFEARPEDSTPALDRLPEFPDGRVGRYRLVRLLAVGGMGLVYEAQQEDLGRPVALKMIRPGLSDPRRVRRFEQEARVLARLEHPWIAQIFDVGVFTSEGEQAERPYFAMELVHGRPITAWCDARGLGTEQRLELFLRVCDAVQHAHDHGVIHRDLKPDNVLVDEQGRPKVVDFGVSRVVAERWASTMHTRTGEIVGTLAYMAPEQVQGRADDADSRADVYALGVLLYELLAGRLPYELGEGSLFDAVRTLRESNPTPLAAAARSCRGDLDTIVGKAIQKDAPQRYGTVAELAADVRRHLAREAIHARPPSTGYRLRTFIRRNRIPVAVAAGLILTLSLGLVGTTWGLVSTRVQAERAEDEARRALAAEAEAEQRADELEKVAEFQAAQLGGIDVPAMGLGLRADLLARAREAIQRRVEHELAAGGVGSGGDGDPAAAAEERVERELAELERLLTGVNFTDAALAALDENIFERTLSAIQEEFEEQPLVKARLLQSIAATLEDLGLIDLAVAPQTEALAIRRRLLGNDHKDTASSVDYMGSLMLAQGNRSEAERYYRESLEISRRIFGDEDTRTLRAMNNLGVGLMHLGRFDEAEPLFRASLEVTRRVQGESHPDTFMSLSNVGHALEGQGRLGEAEPFYRQALEGCRRVLGEEHRQTLDALNNMGFVVSARGDNAKAEQYYREALEGSRRVLGDLHRDTLTTVANLGVAIQQQGRLSEAEPFYREALEGRSRVLGEEHPETLISMNNMGFLLDSMGQSAEAESYHRMALAVRQRVLGPDHPHALDSLANIASVVQAQGRLEEAERFCRKALEGRGRVLGKNHYLTIRSINNMGSLREALGDLDDAETYYRQAFEGFRNAVGNDHPDTLQTLANIGGVLRRLERYEEAEVYLREVLERSRRALGDDHIDTAWAISDLGAVCLDLGRLEEAERLGAEAVALARALLPQGHWTIGAFALEHGRALAAVERFGDAELVLTEAHSVLNALGPDHRRTVNAAGALADLYDAWHAADPEAGHDATAARWRQKLESPEIDQQTPIAAQESQ